MTKIIKNKKLLNHLFTPFASKLSLKNRIVMAPMTRSKCPDNSPTKDVVDYYTARAKGGVGLIITEGTCINHPGAHGYPDIPSFYGKKALKGWKTVLEAVKKYDCKIIPQLWHVGSMRQKGQPPIKDASSYAPTGGIIHPYLPQILDPTETALPPIEIQKQDIEDLIQAYIDAAIDAKMLGFDGIEIHGAHSYLLDQFFWEKTNKRDDKYGGDLKQRTAFACEIIQGICDIVGPNFPVIFRFSQWKFSDFNHKMAKNPKELEDFLRPLQDAGVDIFHCSTHNYAIPEFPDHDSILNLAGWTKKITGLPTITVGSVGIDKPFKENAHNGFYSLKEIDEALQRLKAEEFDLIAFGRTLISNPQLALNLKQENFDKIISYKREMLQNYP